MSLTTGLVTNTRSGIVAMQTSGPIYKISYNEWKAFHKNEIHVHNRNIVGDSVHKLAYDIPEKFQHVLSHYRKSILRQTYDNRIINRKIFCKSGPRSPIRYVDLMEFRLLRARD